MIYLTKQTRINTNKFNIKILKGILSYSHKMILVEYILCSLINGSSSQISKYKQVPEVAILDASSL